MEHTQTNATRQGEEVISTAIGFVTVVGPDMDGFIVSISELAEGVEDKFGQQFRLSRDQLKLLASRPELFSAGGIFYIGTFMGYSGQSILPNGILIRGEAMIDP
jgi:hypothetical protein